MPNKMTTTLRISFLPESLLPAYVHPGQQKTPPNREVSSQAGDLSGKPTLKFNGTPEAVAEGAASIRTGLFYFCSHTKNTPQPGGVFSSGRPEWKAYPPRVSEPAYSISVPIQKTPPNREVSSQAGDWIRTGECQLGR
jgi:hypothetical protein